MTMIIGIDARMLGPQQGGIGRYVEQLTRNLAQIFCHPERSEGSLVFTVRDSSVSASRRIPQNDKNKVNFVIFLRKENWDLVEASPLSPPSEREEQKITIKKVLADIPWYGWREQLLLSKIIKKEKIDLMHFPHWNIPVFYNRPFVVTIHDLLLLRYPTRAASTLGPLSYFFKNIAYRIALNHAIKKSKRIIAPSEFTKQDIIKNFGVKPEKITVTHLAPTPLDSRFRGNDAVGILLRHPPQLAEADQNDMLASRFNIKKPYILYVGVAYPHKNLKKLIEAWDIFCTQHGNNYQLVLAGRKNYFYERLTRTTDYRLQTTDATRQSPAVVRSPSTVVFTGYIPDESLPALYQNASLYIFPSLYEGFGLPPLEAMQYGVPVASSTAACLPEVLKDAALYFDPRNPDEIATAIWRGLTDQKLRESLTQKSVQLIHNYSWITTARQTLEVYHSVI